MKKRIGFVSNSSSSSFVVLKDAITDKQKDMILNCDEWIKFFILQDEGNKSNLKEKFEYYDSDPWNIAEFDDFIFGETSMDNFDISDYFKYIKVSNKYIKWDDGWNTEPYQSQLEFIKQMKKIFRKNKLKKINSKNK